MSQEIVVDYPPMYEEIAEAFPKIDPRLGVIFSWGDRVFNPFNSEIGPHLLVHEAIHGARQGGSDASIREWWRRYIEEPAFRLEEEIYAHRAEYHFLRQHGNRNQRRIALKQIAKRLSSPLYGRLISTDRARRELKLVERLNEAA